MTRIRNLLFCSVAAGALAACTAIPASGPRTSEVENSARQFSLIDLTPGSASVVAADVAQRRKLEPVVLPPKHAMGLVGAGDLLKIVVWQPNAAAPISGSGSGGNDKSGLETTTRVGTDGSISVPYAGRIAAAGRTPAAIEAALTAKLGEQMPGAQVAVLVTEDVTNNVIVQGDVAKPGRYPVIPGSTGLLDVLAEAGGAHTPDRQTLVRITRGRASVTRSLSQLVSSHALEADLAPGDRILVEPRQRFFYAFGAVLHPGEFAYDADILTLAHALARLNGLSDTQADPAAVFVFRRQSADLTRRLHPADAADPTQVIYRLNLRQPGGFFVAQTFPILPDDMLYVSDAPMAEAGKVFQVLTGVGNIGAIPRNLGAPY
jgi:polysaccharide export outer membrane protein